MKVLAVLAALILLPSVLFAVPVVITWEWLLEDPLVTTFRYQVDGENADAWTVVDSSVTSYTQRGLDGTIAHTLYLQQSYDGVNFSDSAQSVAQPMFPVEQPAVQTAEQPAPVQEQPVAESQPVAAEQPAPVQEQPVAESQPVVAEQPAPVQEQPVAESQPVVAEQSAPVQEQPVAEAAVSASTEPVVPVAEAVVPMPEQVAANEPAVVEPQPVVQESAPALEAPAAAPVAEAQPSVAESAPVAQKAKAASRAYSTLTLGGVLNFQNPALSGSYSRFNVQAELGLQLNNLMTFNDSLGLGVDIGLAYSPYMNSYSWSSVAKDLLAFDFATPISHLDHAITVSVSPMLNMEFGKTVFDLGLGGFFTYGPSLADTNSDHMLYGAFAKAGFEYKFNKTFSLGVNGKYGLILSEGGLSSLSTIPQFAEGTVYMGFSF
jgi:hypothetical protein